MKDRLARGWLPLVAGAPIFVALAIANSAGYRYGVSDLAFYLPAAFHRLDPHLFPRDAVLLDVQARLTLADEVLATALRAGHSAGFSTETTVYLLHIASLVVLYLAAAWFATTLFRSRWAVVAFLAALTLRHAVGRAGVNTLEGYFHPRVFAFAIGVLALAAFLRRGIWPALVLGLIAAAFHTTTAFWFLVCLGVAGLVSERRDRVPLLALGILATGLLAYASILGPLSGRLEPMDAQWLAVIAEKDYLFPDRWPWDAWLIAALYVGLCGYAGVRRWRAGTSTPRERALFAGAATLVLAFLVLLPPLWVRSALTVQMQPSRVFWIVDLLATASLVWLLGDRPAGRGIRGGGLLAVALLAFSFIRGTYLVTVRFPERSVVQMATPVGDWADVMRFARTTDVGSHWLAHPDHTYLYGTGLRVSGQRDVLVDRAKDPAIAMYDRDVAMRVADRLAAVGDFDALTPARARALADRYDLDFMVTELPLALPVVYSNAKFTVYDLRTPEPRTPEPRTP